MTDELLSLTSFCPPEAEAPARRDRGPRGAGRAPVPESHLRLSHAYGAGCFDEFLWVFVVARRSSTGLVLDLMTGALRIPFFPEDFPSSRPRFSAKP